MSEYVVNQRAEQERLASLMTPSHCEPPEILAANGVEALWTGSVNHWPGVVELGGAMLERCSTDEARTLDTRAYAASVLAAPFAGVHMAWARGDECSSELVSDAQTMLEPAVQFARHDSSATRTFLARAVFHSLSMRDGGTDPLIMPGASAWDGHNSYIFHDRRGGRFRAADIDVLDPIDRTLTHPEQPVTVGMFGFTSEVLYKSGYKAREAARKRSIDHKTLAVESLTIIADALLAEYAGTATGGQIQLLDRGTTMAKGKNRGAARAPISRGAPRPTSQQRP
ncbi:MAG TPA: hypothetical protein VLF71_03955 [Candidatus Saccharimonadales bacterium]|nr:hypothetical protein [Candidatus Saccharimonadales bacterium]